jgi:arylsulfatase
MKEGYRNDSQLYEAMRKLPAGKVNIAFEMRTPLERAAPAEVAFWINGKKAASGTVQRTVPLTFTASETFDVGVDTNSPVADDYFKKAPFAFEGTLKRLYFKNLQAERPAFKRSPDDD